MAEGEDGGSEILKDGDDNEEAVKDKINNEDRIRQYRQRSKSPPCRTRFDVLSIPNRRLILELYQKHAYHLSREKVEKIKELLQELYAMTPEETKKYFMELEQENSKKWRRKRLKELLKKQYMKQKMEKDIAKAYRLFAKILRNCMMFAVTHAVPPLVSVRLRNLSDIVLEQICDLRNVTKPNRDDPDREGLFFIAISDWIAVAIEQVYYDVQLKKNEELEKLEKEKEELDNTKKKDPVGPQKTPDSMIPDKDSKKDTWTDEIDENEWED